jgi:hypothetical protein
MPLSKLRTSFDQGFRRSLLPSAGWPPTSRKVHPGANLEQFWQPGFPNYKSTKPQKGICFRTCKTDMREIPGRVVQPSERLAATSTGLLWTI